MQTKLLFELKGPYGQLMYEKIGEGSFSIVYRTAPGSGCAHVLKKPSQYNFDNYVTYRNELETLSFVIQPQPHPNIIQFIDGYYEERPYLFKSKSYLAFESINGGDLSSYLLEHPASLPLQIRYKILLGVAQGLDHLHTHCFLVHRDLKAENIVLDFSDHQIVPKIIDFGLSLSIPTTHSVLVDVPCGGSPPYVSPETLSEHTCSAKSDIYALSVLMYVMIHFSYPFNSLFSSDINENVAQGLDLVRQGYREELSSVISMEDQKMIHDTWAPNPIDRPTAREVVEYLELLLMRIDLLEVAPPLSFPEKKSIKLWQGPRFGIFDTQEKGILETTDPQNDSDESSDEDENSCLGFLSAWLSSSN